jgi:penicillin amidase
MDTTQLLTVLRSGLPLAAALERFALSRAAFDAALAQHLRSKLPVVDGKGRVKVRGSARILRDGQGVPHIAADNAHDLFFAYGYATAQDRLWQLDYLRRAAHGRLAEILGPEAVPNDVEVRTVGIGRLATELAGRLPAATADILTAFCDGVNAVIEASRDRWPIEFDILDYAPEPWSPADSLALMKHFWWQLTGRLFQITGPELMKRALGDGPLYQAFLRSEVHGETIIPPGENRGAPAGKAQAGSQLDGAASPPGSNNWLLSPAKSTTGKPLMASDPHTPYGAPTIWYEAHLHGAGYDVAGMGYVGVPGIIFGRNVHGAWGITNNICSQRDLFVLPMEAAHTDGYTLDGKRYAAWEHTESLHLSKNRDVTVQLVQLRFSDHGPIVNPLLTPAVQQGPPVALRWVGTEISDEIGCLLAVNRAASATEFRQALSGWACPTFNFVWADASGDIAYQCVGKLPRRAVPGRALRSVADPQQHWQGFFSYEENPWCVSPKQGWLGTANNPVLAANEDPGLGGMWTTDVRQRRIRRKLDGQAKFTLDECAVFQMDTVSERARDVVAALAQTLEAASDPQLQKAAGLLKEWDGDMRGDSAAPAIFDAFARHWANVVLDERVSSEARDLVARHVFGLMFELLKDDPAGWFAPSKRPERIQTAMRLALDDLSARLGPNPAKWRWGDIHTLTLRHPLGKRPPLSEVFDDGPHPIGGSSHTINNQWTSPTGTYEATAGANCRIAADLGTPELRIINCLGQSGHPGSEHYRDQLDDWLHGRQHVQTLDWKQVEAAAKHRLELAPNV